MSSLLTIAEIAKRLDIPESTARYYRDRFSEFVPSVGDGRQRRYRPAAIEVLRIVAEGFKNELSATEIKSRLSAIYPLNVEVDNEQQQQTAAAQQQTLLTPEDRQREIVAREKLAAALQALADQKEKLMQLDKKDRELEEKSLELERRISKLEERDAPEPGKKLTWWEKIFGRR